ncbi:MAG TPA: response regulator [Chitinophagaceae bacterium]|jgi:CheY-like chemotaxis protein|nr:response regulator [Chitinophagaceae bacterium]
MEKLITILLVEDDQLDVMDIKRSLDKLKILYQLFEARNGEEAVRWLQGREAEGQPLPDVVLIDINMPRMNGLELLQVIRTTESWKRLKCFIITTSSEQVDKEQAARLNVSGYIVKPFKINNPASIDSFNLMIDLMNMKVS